MMLIDKIMLVMALGLCLSYITLTFLSSLKKISEVKYYSGLLYVNFGWLILSIVHVIKDVFITKIGPTPFWGCMIVFNTLICYLTFSLLKKSQKKEKLKNFDEAAFREKFEKRNKIVLKQ